MAFRLDPAAGSRHVQTQEDNRLDSSQRKSLFERGIKRRGSGDEMNTVNTVRRSKRAKVRGRGAIVTLAASNHNAGVEVRFDWELQQRDGAIRTEKKLNINNNIVPGMMLR